MDDQHLKLEVALTPENSAIYSNASFDNNLVDGLVDDAVTNIDSGGGRGVDGQGAFVEYDEDEELDAYFDSFPAGYRFRPYDEELVVDYLMPKIKNSQLPPNRIKEVELYKYNPETLAATYKCNGEKEWYFFTPRDRKYRNGQRPNRAAGDGYWKATGADKAITQNKIRVGLKKSLVFYLGKPPKGVKTDWIMHEYRVDTSPKRRSNNNDMRLDDWVLCRIHKKPDKSSKVSNRQRNNAKPITENGTQANQIQVVNENLVDSSKMQQHLQHQRKPLIMSGTPAESYLNNNYGSSAASYPNPPQNGLLAGALPGVYDFLSDQSDICAPDFDRLSMLTHVSGYPSPLYNNVDQYMTDDLQMFDIDNCGHFTN